MTSYGMKTPEWTQRYFGKLYGQLYSRHLLPSKQTRQEAEFARQVLELRGKRVLDLACGFGRHSKILARHTTVVGLDLNNEYLRQAVREFPKRLTQRFAPIRGDMRQLPLRDNSFDAVLLLFNSFGYFVQPPASPSLNVKRELWKLPQVFYERGLVPNDFGCYRPQEQQEASARSSSEENSRDENEEVLKEIARVLVPGGRLLIEAPNPRPLIEAVMSAPRRWLITKDFEIEEEFSYDRLRKILSNVTRFALGDHVEVADYYLRIYSRRELSAALRRAGFTIIELFGSYDGEPYSPTVSPCMIFHAKKREDEKSHGKRSRG